MSGIWLVSHLGLWTLVIFQGIIIIALLRGFTGLHQRLEEKQETRRPVRLAPGAVLADDEVLELAGRRIELSQLWQRGNLLILFASVDCAPCHNLLTWIGDAVRNGQFSDWDLCVLCAGHESQVRKFAQAVELPKEIPLGVIEYASLRWRYHIAGTPTLAIVEEHGRVVDVVAGEIEAYLKVLSRRSKFRIPA